MTLPRCVVLGGGGFIGHHLIKALLAEGHQVTCFDRAEASAAGSPHAETPAFEAVSGDFLSRSDVAGVLRKGDICFHLVSTTLPSTSNTDPAFDLETNLIGSVRLLESARDVGVGKIVYVSSGGTVYGIPREVPVPESHPNEPLCSYGITKLAVEKYLALFQQLHGLDHTVLRIANPYGEMQRTNAAQGAVAVFLAKALRGEPVEIWGDGSIVRDYVYIGDVARALVCALHYRGTERVFNIGSGQGRSLNDVLDTIDRILGRPALRRYKQARNFDVPANVLSIERANRLLSWSPQVGFEEGVRRYAKWLSDHLGVDAGSSATVNP